MKSRHLNFGIGVNLVLIGLALGSWIRAMDRDDNLPVAAIVAAVLIGPGATMIGKDADVEMRHCLVAAMWGSGVEIGERAGSAARARFTGPMALLIDARSERQPARSARSDFHTLQSVEVPPLLAASLAPAGEPSMWEASANKPVPPGAKVTLELDRSGYFLGENVLVHFILENTSDQPFEADFGGDYRGATRHLRFKVTATDESGRAAEDPNPSEGCLGGLGSPQKLKPGDTFTQSVPLTRYCRMLQPGRYTIRATHDFGWKENERKRPVGEISVVFRMPTPTEAEAVVAAMEKLPTDPSGSNCATSGAVFWPSMGMRFAGAKRSS